VSSERAWLQALQRVSKLVAEQHLPEDVTREALTSALTLLGAEVAALYRWDESAGVLSRLDSVGPRALDIAPFVQPDDGLVGYSFTQQTSVVENAYVRSPYGHARARDADVRAVLIVPLTHRGQRFGVISAGIYCDDRPIGEVDAEGLSLLAGQVAVMLEDAERTAQLERRIERIRTLNRLTRLVSTSLDLDDVLGEIAHAAVELTGAAFASFWMADEAAQVLRRGAYSDDGMAADTDLRTMPYGDGTAGRAAQSRKRMLIDDVFADGHTAILDWWERNNLRSILAVPVVQGDRLLAVLALNGRAPFRLDALDNEVLDSFLAQASIAILNASLYADVRRHREQLQAIIDHSPAAINLRDPCGRYLLTNRRWKQLRRDDQVAGPRGDTSRGPNGGQPEHDDGAVLAADDLATLTKGHTIESEVVLYEDGQRLTFLSSTFPLFDATGTLYALGTICTNITDRKRLEDSIAASLEAQQAANVRLEQLHHAQSEFLAVMSHEFRTPLTGIQGLSELMRDEDFDPSEVQQFASDINREAERLTRMITGLLDLERMEAGQMQVYREPVDLGQVVKDVVERTRPTTTAHTLCFEISVTLPPVTADRDKLTQVVVNLLSNAIKYAPDGGEITVGVGWWRQGAVPMAHLWVRDQGLGIPAESLATVFDRYTRVELSARRGIQGTGLGLPIVGQIVELHCGRVWVESEVGRGSTFHVLLPLDGQATPATG
jgi:signal transduction histidine kinase